MINILLTKYLKTNITQAHQIKTMAILLKGKAPDAESSHGTKRWMFSSPRHLQPAENKSKVVPIKSSCLHGILKNKVILAKYYQSFELHSQ